MTKSEILESFERDGFVVIPGFLSHAELSELDRNLYRYYVRVVMPSLRAARGPASERTSAALPLLQDLSRDPYFASYPGRVKWVSLAESLLGGPVELEPPFVLNKPAGTTSATPPHQDNYLYREKVSGSQLPRILNMWLALDPMDDENGCLRFVRGSHRHGARSHTPTELFGFAHAVNDYGPRDEALEVPIHLQPGDLSCHHGDLIHRAEPNRSSGRSRRALSMLAYQVQSPR